MTSSDTCFEKKQDIPLPRPRQTSFVDRRVINRGSSLDTAAEVTNKPREGVYGDSVQPVTIHLEATGGRRMQDQEEQSRESGVSGIIGFELRLVLEFCDCGNLRQALDQVRAIIICKPNICIII